MYGWIWWWHKFFLWFLSLHLNTLLGSVGVLYNVSQNISSRNHWAIKPSPYAFFVSNSQNQVRTNSLYFCFRGANWLSGILHFLNRLLYLIILLLLPLQEFVCSYLHFIWFCQILHKNNIVSLLVIHCCIDLGNRSLFCLYLLEKYNVFLTYVVYC